MDDLTSRFLDYFGTIDPKWQLSSFPRRSSPAKAYSTNESRVLEWWQGMTRGLVELLLRAVYFRVAGAIIP